MTKFNLLAGIVFILGMAGCVSVGTSPSPRFYMLSAIEKDKVLQTFDIKPNVIIEVGPVKIPEYQNRPQIVIQNKDKTLTFSEFNRWGESLDVSLARLINQDIDRKSTRLNSSHPQQSRMPSSA